MLFLISFQKNYLGSAYIQKDIISSRDAFPVFLSFGSDRLSYERC